MILDLANIRALVTGGTRGIGRAVVETLAAGGARVAANYKGKGTQADDLGRLLGSRGIEHLILKTDVTQERAVSTMMRRIEEAWDGLDLLVINHGVRDIGPFTEMTAGAWRDAIGTNLTGAFTLLSEALPLMRRDAGEREKRIILVAASAGLRGEPRAAGFAASKGGLVALTRSLAGELGPEGFTVNAVAPGRIETDSTADELADVERRERLRATIPLGRFGRPTDVAAAVAFLASRQASWISGEVMLVNGGSGC